MPASAQVISLRETQEEVIEGARQSLRKGHKRIIIQAPTGFGKCLGRGTPVLMYDGTIRNVEDIVAGEVLMGPDSRPRHVLSVCSGTEQLYRVTPVKGDAYIVNESHILSLKRTPARKNPTCKSDTGGQIINISVADYLTKSKTFKHRHKGWRVPVEFGGHKTLTVNPYFLGVWLADGDHRDLNITVSSKEVMGFLLEHGASTGMQVSRRYNSPGSEMVNLVTPRGKRSPLLDEMRSLGVISNKHIPHEYKTASREDRLSLLAGLLDGDGYYAKGCYEISQKSERLAEDILFLARSLGFAAYLKKVKKQCVNTGKWGAYFRCSITGHTDEIPCKVISKKADKRRQIKDALVTGISVDPIGEGEYFGFEIDGDGLFLLGDFTVTHNTRVAAAIIQSAILKGRTALFLAPRRELVYQASETLKGFGIQNDIIMSGEDTGYYWPVKVASKDTLYHRGIKNARMIMPTADLVIGDECFTPDVEILTEDGFVRFDALKKGKRVAQYDEGNISFVQPYDYIEKDYSGDIVNLYSDNLIDLDMTPGHELLVKWPNEWRKQSVDRVKFNHNKQMAVAGLSTFEDDGQLTPHERLIIALQADGSVRRETTVGYSVDFHFSKPRKIAAIESIAREGGFKLSEVKGSLGSGNVNYKRRFLVHRLPYVSKNLTEHFDITRLSAKKAKAIIDEAMTWDGHVREDRQSQLYFSSTDERAVDFYQSVALLAGYRTRKAIQKDARKESYRDVHRLYIQNGTNLIGCQAIKKKSWRYEGKVCCVRVPAGNIVVRRNGRPLIIGNCHLALSHSWKAIFDYYRSATLIGFTATPAGPRGRGLGEIYEDIVFSWPMQKLIDHGYLVAARYFAPTDPDLSDIAIDYKTGDYAIEGVNGVASRMDETQIIGDVYQNWERIAGDKQTVVFGCTRAHGQHLCHEFLRHGVKAEYVDGETPTELRAAIFSRIKSGQTQVLCNCLVLTYGVDIPSLECAVIARPTKDIRMYLQVCGRVLRPSPATGKTEAIIIDHAGVIKEHGYVTDPIPWSLEGKETVYERKERIQKKKTEEGEKIQKDIKCCRCSAMFRGRRDCPSCGFVAIPKGEPVPIIEAELHEVNRDDESLQRKRNREISFEAKAWFYGQLKQYAKEKGYKPGWAARKYQERYSVWPNDKRVSKAPSRSVTKNVANWIKNQQIRWAKARSSA